MPPKKTQASRTKGTRRQPVSSNPKLHIDPKDAKSVEKTLTSNPRLSVNPAFLGPHNTLKQLLAKSSTPIDSKTTLHASTPNRRTNKTRQTLPLSPINSARTPLSRLKYETAQLNSHENIDSLPIHFDDIETESPPQKKRRPGRPRKTQVSPSKVNTKSRSTVSRKTPKILGFSDEEDEQEKMESPPHNDIALRADGDNVFSNNRRTSYNNRGKRGLSIGNGFVTTPHPDVSEKDYFKHLDLSMSEPSRMRQLLAWCFRKAIETQEPRGHDFANDSETAEKVAKTIEEEFLRDLKDGKINTSWYAMHDNVTPDPVLAPGDTIHLPNPLNESNKEGFEVYKVKLANLLEEKEKLLSAYESSVAALDGFRLRLNDTSDENLRDHLRKRQAASKIPESILDKLVPKKIQGIVNNVKSGVENDLEQNVDKLYQLLCRMRGGVKLVSKFGQEVLEPEFGNLVHKFANREKANGKETCPSTFELLKGIANVKDPNAS